MVKVHIFESHASPHEAMGRVLGLGKAGVSWGSRWHTGGTFDIYARGKKGQGWSLALVNGRTLR